ncbi:MAG: hypothetical protein ACXW27_06030 [Allosphingosinicella sp.]
MPIELTFGQVEAVLARLNRIADHKRVAFMSRLKHLQKNGCPQRAPPGRGKPGSYSFSQLMQAAIAVDLLQSGLPPALSARITTGNWLTLRPTIYMATYSASAVKEMNQVRASKGGEEMPPPEEWLWMISPEALRDMTQDGLGEFDHYEAIVPVRLSEANRQIESGINVGVFGEGWRTLVIHGSRLTQAVMTMVCFHFRFAEWGDLRADLLAEIEEDERRHHELSKMIRDGDLIISDPAARAELKRRFGELRETDFSTNPPTPPSKLVERAREIIRQIDAAILEPLMAEEGTPVEISNDQLQNLLLLRLVEIDDEGVQITLLGSIVNQLFCGSEKPRL